MAPEGQRIPHPSEALHFVTIAGQPGIQHVEFAEKYRNGSGSADGDGSHIDVDSPLSPSLASKNLALRVKRLSGLIDSSEAAMNAEHRLTIFQGLRLYPKAIGWSVLLSLTIIMEGYDLSIINSFYAFPEFKMAYGELDGTGEYQITPPWQSALTNGALVGEIFGLLINGYLNEKFGYRTTLIVSLIWLSACIFFAFFAVNIRLLMASEVLCGLSWGVFQTLSTTYAAEIMPVALRAYLTSNVNMCWVIGQLIGVGVLRGLINLESQWSYRIPFGLQWMWAVPILVGVLFAPESPWWLVRKGHYKSAKNSLLRLTTKGLNFNADETVLLMKQTNEVEKYLSEGNSYFDCFKGVNLRRTEIACMIWMTQTLCGSPLTGYATYFYVQAGFSPERAFDLSVGMYGMAIMGGVISWFLLPLVGRRTLYLCGTGLMCIILAVGGAISTQHDAPWISWTLGSLVILLTFVYDTTIGPVCYSLVSEIPSTRLRVKTVVLARVAYNLVTIISNILMPKMLNPTAWDWKGKTCFLWAGPCLFCFVWCFFRLPEPKGLTYLELDLLFEKKIPARKFRRVQNTLAESGYFDIGLPNSRFLSGWHSPNVI